MSTDTYMTDEYDTGPGEAEKLEGGYPEVDDPTGRTLSGTADFRDQLFAELERLHDEGESGVEPYLSDSGRVDQLLREHGLEDDPDNIDEIVDLILEP